MLLTYTNIMAYTISPSVRARVIYNNNYFIIINYSRVRV